MFANQDSGQWANGKFFKLYGYSCGNSCFVNHGFSPALVINQMQRASIHETVTHSQPYHTHIYHRKFWHPCSDRSISIFLSKRDHYLPFYRLHIPRFLFDHLCVIFGIWTFSYMISSIKVDWCLVNSRCICLSISMKRDIGKIKKTTLSVFPWI